MTCHRTASEPWLHHTHARVRELILSVSVGHTSVCVPASIVHECARTHIGRPCYTQLANSAERRVSVAELHVLAVECPSTPRKRPYGADSHSTTVRSVSSAIVCKTHALLANWPCMYAYTDEHVEHICLCDSSITDTSSYDKLI